MPLRHPRGARARRTLRRRTLSAGLIATSLALGLAPAPARGQGGGEGQEHPGKAAYDRWCAGCHGVDGRGDGEAAGYMLPRPRDFTRALFQIRSTPSGALPTDEDLMRVIDEGMPGTAMPGWRTLLSRSEREAIVDYIKTFSPFFAQGDAPQPLEFGSAPRTSEEVLREGREFYQRIECWKCHGEAGRGDGPSAPTQEDDAGFPIRPADLTENWHFNGGGTVEDIYRRLRTGLDGTPMPSFSDLLDAGYMTEAQLWNLAHYVRSLSPAEPPRVRDVIRAARIEGALPSSADDSAWAAVERYYIPLVGQIVVKPRWFAPTVDGVWVQALHNGEELALRLVWHDPSQSPDTAWLVWQRRVLETMEPHEGGPQPAAGAASAGVPAPAAAPAGRAGAGPAAAAAAASAAVPGEASIDLARLPDAIAVQFPRTIPRGMERPYFLMGDARQPVYLWRWQSVTEAGVGGAQAPSEGVAVEATARGLARIEPLPATSRSLSWDATFDQGEWRLLLRRPLATADTVNQLQFRPGEPIPIALFAWDGSNSEEGTRCSIGTWYFIYLDQPTPGTVYATPVVAAVLTAGLGLVAVVRAQRRERSEGSGV
ncbi:MAG TPA: c-type cytochrome [Longimicrobiales bacterium]